MVVSRLFIASFGKGISPGNSSLLTFFFYVVPKSQTVHFLHYLPLDCSPND
jgi:hypothetical protein